MVVSFGEYVMNESYGPRLVQKALGFAIKAHEGQIRKHVNEPYVEHVKRVAATVKAHGFDHHVQAAALLHDTIEDCGVKAATIHKNFGSRVGHMVEALSDLPKEAGNRSFRVKANHARLSASSHEVQSIKYADTMDNAPSIIKHDPDFAKVFIKEKHHLLSTMDKGHPGLYKKAKKAVGME